MDANNRPLFIRACRGEVIERPPIWLMRQAGRYQPEYQKLRKKHSFLQLCQTPELAAQVSLIPFHYFPVDAAIIFSDLLIPLLSMGGEIEYLEGGPIIRNPIRCACDVAALKEPEKKSIFPIASAIRQLKASLPDSTPVIGFASAPFTLCCYLVEGKGSNHFELIKSLLYREPSTYLSLCDRLKPLLADFLSAQIEAGASAVQIFDTWAGHLSPEDYRHFALLPLQSLIEEIKARHRSVPIIYYINGISHLVKESIETGADVLSCDWRVNLGDVRDCFPSVVLQGNLDPALLLGNRETLASRAGVLLDQMAPGGKYIFNLGHGILPSTPIDAVQFLVKFVQEWRRA